MKYSFKVIIFILVVTFSYFFISDIQTYISLVFFSIVLLIFFKLQSMLEEKEKKLKIQKNMIINLFDITDNVNYPLCIIDPNNKITYANKMFKSLIKKYHDNIDLNEVISDIEKDIFEFNNKTYQKEIFENESGYKKLFFLDISEKIKLENIRKDFSANVSHELKTPLTTIIGYSELLSIGRVEKEKVTEISKKIYNQATNLLELLEDIIKISKLEEGNYENLEEEINIYDIFKEMFVLLQKKIEVNNIKINIEQKESMIIFANKTIIKEIIYNLLSNAIKYNNDKKIINIKIYKNKFSVENTAELLSQEEIERIFERFYRGNKKRIKNINGNGLGLSIVKHAVTLNNWKIKVENTKTGVKFIIFI